MDANDKLFYRLNDRSPHTQPVDHSQGGDPLLYEDEIRSVEGPGARRG